MRNLYTLIALTVLALPELSGQTVPYILISNQRYTKKDTLKADIYLPQNYRAQQNPVLIFFTAGNSRKWPHYTDWAILAATQGFAAIAYSAKHDDYAQNFDELIAFLESNDRQYRFDMEKIVMYAGSGNVMDGFPLANANPKIKAAVIYYGAARLKEYRIDLPVLLLRVGLDNTQLNKALDTLAFRALQANAPYTIMNANDYLHAFEDVKDPEAKRVMLTSLDFLKTSLRPQIQEAFKKHRGEIMAMRELYHAHWREALVFFQEALAHDPGNNETERQIGNIYIELGEYRLALKSFNDALAHGNWRKGEIAKKKCLAYAKLDDAEAAVAEMRILRKIGWFNEAEYNQAEYKSVTTSAAYRKFLSET